LAQCPEGSETAPKFLLILVFGIISFIIYLLYLWKNGADIIREKKRKSELVDAAMLLRMQDKPDVHALEKTFTIEFENLGLTLPNGLEIMSQVNGVLRSGRVCAIMGPSGSGKTTFVTLLTGKQPRSSGTVKLNGVYDELKNYSKLIGYVPQEDIMLRELTVRDILIHSAKMRLPRSWNYQKVKKK
jgi:ATPase subunit of ABC transporter with duplicated ATPase domains